MFSGDWDESLSFFFKVILFCFIFATPADMVMSAAKKTTSAKGENNIYTVHSINEYTPSE